MSAPWKNTVSERIRRPRSGRRLLQVVVAVLAILLVGAVVIERSGDGPGTEEAEAREVVVQHLEKLLSYTPSTVESDLETELSYLTGSFADDYENLVRTVIAPAVAEGGVSTEVDAVRAGVVEVDGDSLEALVFVNVTTRSAAQPDAQVAGSRLKVQMTKVDDEWRITQFDPI